MENKSKPTHTPTPWNLQERKDYTEHFDIGSTQGRIAWIPNSATHADGVAEANAAFIVQAVNAHEELLMRIILDGIIRHSKHGFKMGIWLFRDCTHPECEEYHRLIAKAEGK